MIDAENDYFVSFNYTLVLEKIYGAKNVCHVHGNTKNNIIMGHGNLSEMKLITMDDAKRVGKKTQNERMFKIKNEKSNYINEYLTMEDINLCMFYMCDNGNNRLIKGKVQDKLYRELYYLKEYSHRNIRYNRREERNEILRPTNSQIIQIENVLNKIHSILSKNTSEALKTIIKFINEIDIWETIDNIYSIGFSYSDVDMKVIQIISLLGANAWYLNNYNYADLDIQIRKIKKCSFYRIGQFDFTKELL